MTVQEDDCTHLWRYLVVPDNDDVRDADNAHNATHRLCRKCRRVEKKNPISAWTM